MLTLSTGCRAEKTPLAVAVASFREFDLDGVALHRPPTPEEARALAALPRRLPVVAVFGAGGADVGCRLLVVEGEPAGKSRAESLDALCRRLHALRPFRVGVLPPSGEGDHPTPEELPLLFEAVPNAGYFHDPSRAGIAYLDAADARLLGARFDPLGGVDLRALRDALGSRLPAVVETETGAPRAAVEEAVRAARGVFRA